MFLKERKNERESRKSKGDIVSLTTIVGCATIDQISLLVLNRGVCYCLAIELGR